MDIQGDGNGVSHVQSCFYHVVCHDLTWPYLADVQILAGVAGRNSM